MLRLLRLRLWSSSYCGGGTGGQLTCPQRNEMGETRFMTWVQGINLCTGRAWQGSYTVRVLRKPSHGVSVADTEKNLRLRPSHNPDEEEV